VKHYAMTVLLKEGPEVIRKYEKYHTEVWPEVTDGNIRCGILRTFIFRHGRQLFMFMETRDDFDMERDMPKYMEHPKAKEWDDLMRSFQEPAPGAPEGSTWVQMKEVFGFEAGQAGVCEQSGRSEEVSSRKRRVIDARRVVPFIPKGAEGRYESRMLIDDESVGSKNLVMNHFTLSPGERTYPGSHPPPYDEVYYILRGRGILTLGDSEKKQYEMAQDTVAYMPGGTVHQIENTGKDLLEMLTIMPFLPKPGVNTLYDERKRRWGTSFKEEEPQSPAKHGRRPVARARKRKGSK